MKDFTIQNHGSVVILTPTSAAGRDWVAQHLPPDHMTWGRVGVVVEPRFVSDIVDGIEGDGLEVE
jgi:hypothetical protein